MTRFVWIAVALSLSACGFHLRGAMPLPDQLRSMSLDCPSARERIFCLALERQLTANNIDTGAPDSAYELKITDVETDRRTVSINERGVASEIQLNLASTFTLLAADGSVVIPSTVVNAYQSYHNDQNQVLGKGREEQQINRELSQQLATQIMSRIAATAPRFLESAEQEAAPPEAYPVPAPQRDAAP